MEVLYTSGIIAGAFINNGVQQIAKSFELARAVDLAGAVATYALSAFVVSSYQGDMSKLIVANLQTLGITTIACAFHFSREKYVITARVSDTDPGKVVKEFHQVNKAKCFAMLSIAFAILHISTIVK